MAENEILDVKGRRWRHIRAALIKPDLSITEMAECVVDNFQSVIQRSLANALRKGQPLLLIFRAIDQHPSAMRAAVGMFQDQQLARIVRNATLVAKTKDISSIALCVTDMLFAGLKEGALVLAKQNGCFQERGRIEALKTELENALGSRRNDLSKIIEASLLGQAVKRRSVAKQKRIPVTARSLVLSPLAIRKGGGNHAPRPY